MLISHPYRQPVDSVKHWFADINNDLFVWLNTNQQIIAFQYSYNKSVAEHVISWSLQNGFSHGRVDDGENVHLQIKMSPIIVPAGDANSVQIAERFLQVSSKLDPQLVDFIYRKLLAYLPKQA